ncbi:hypothetical protein THOM_1485 [Trachipleistophora hominis]|uniref:Uncharacterized protein n=1 Tax=Trachipleistophora hominis TaxID=72359 RepID=L7JXR8_TRAHO|nr:hypothetical protein THOM_1485 [Trachipleistophora hominis]
MLKKKMLKDQNFLDREEAEKKEMELKKLKREYEHMKGSLNQKEDIIQLQNKVIKQLENNNQKMKMVYGDEQYDNDLESSLVLLDRKINDNKKKLPETKDKTPMYVDVGDVLQRNNDKNVQQSIKNPKTGGTNEKSTKKRKTNVKSIKNMVKDKKVPFSPPKVKAQIKQETPKQPPEDRNVSFFQNLTFSDSSPVIKKPFFKKP